MALLNPACTNRDGAARLLAYQQACCWKLSLPGATVFSPESDREPARQTGERGGTALRPSGTRQDPKSNKQPQRKVPDMGVSGATGKLHRRLQTSGQKRNSLNKNLTARISLTVVRSK